MTVLLVLVYVRLITVRLVTGLGPTEIAVGLRGLWRKRKISLDQVRVAKAVEYDPVRDFGGYGEPIKTLRPSCNSSSTPPSGPGPPRQTDRGVPSRTVIMNGAVPNPDASAPPSSARSECFSAHHEQEDHLGLRDRNSGSDLP